jgi:glycosyltransferase involved in cell wall biosynthesis
MYLKKQLKTVTAMSSPNLLNAGSNSKSRSNLGLSIVSPFYNEADGIELFISELLQVLETIDLNYEIILVDDGSSDDSYEIVKNMQVPNLRIIRFEANAGHMHALSAGLIAANGSLIVTMDSDLQHPPIVIPKLLEEYAQTQADVVYAVRESRSEEGIVKRTTASMYYRVMRTLTGIDIQDNAADFRLITKRVREVLLQISEPMPIYRLLIPSFGFSESSVTYVASKRMTGASKYTFKKMLSLGWASVVSFSIRPLRFSLWLGLLSILIAAIWQIYVLVTVFQGDSDPGWASLLSAVIFFGGVQLLTLGLIGEYVGRIYMELKKRPQYIVKND